jgi:hypothetical protein
MAVEPLPSTLLHDRMPVWWRPFTVEPEGEPLARVRSGVEELRRALSFENAVDAVAYAFGDEAAGERIIDTVRSAAPPVGGGYVAVGDAAPPAFVAAALADQLAVAPDSDISTLISLLVLSADYSERQPAIEGMGLADYAARQLEHRSASTRRLLRVALDPPASELVNELLRLRESVGGERSMPTTDQAGVDCALAALAARLDEIAARIDAEHTIVREQLQLHAWTTQAWCEAAETDWSDLPAAARPLLGAVELAQRTHLNAPAINADALLANVLEATGGAAGRTLDSAAAVAAGGPYLAGRLERAPNALLFPIASELTRWREQVNAHVLTGAGPFDAGGGDWRQRDELAIALQAYREALALRLLGHE